MTVHKLEVQGVLNGTPIEILYNFDFRSEPTYTPEPTASEANPATLLSVLGWTGPEITVFRSGEILQFRERWRPVRQVLTPEKHYEPIVDVPTLKTVLEARYDRTRADRLADNVRKYEGQVTAFLQADDTWGQE